MMIFKLLTIYIQLRTSGHILLIALFVSCTGELPPYLNTDEIIFQCRKRDRLTSSHLDCLTYIVLIGGEKMNHRCAGKCCRMTLSFPFQEAYWPRAYKCHSISWRLRLQIHSCGPAQNKYSSFTTSETLIQILCVGVCVCEEDRTDCWKVPFHFSYDLGWNP